MQEKADSRLPYGRTDAYSRQSQENPLLEIARLLADAVDLNLFFEALARGLQYFLPIDRASLTLYDAERNQFELVALALQKESRLGKGWLIPHSGSRTGMAFDSRRPYLYSLERNSRFFEDGPLAEEGLRFAAQVPVIANGTCLGTFNTDSRQLSGNPETHISLLCGVASHIATALVRVNRLPKFVGEDRHHGGVVRQKSVRERLSQTYFPLVRPSIRSSLDRIMAIARSDATVLLIGETRGGP